MGLSGNNYKILHWRIEVIYLYKQEKNRELIDVYRVWRRC